MNKQTTGYEPRTRYIGTVSDVIGPDRAILNQWLDPGPRFIGPSGRTIWHDPVKPTNESDPILTSK
jgi:hypothetical protein